MNFKGLARRLTDGDLPRIGAMIGVGEDEIHAILDVESAGSGFDSQGRPKILFEPHVFYRCLPEHKRQQAVSAGLAYPSWIAGQYPKDSYPRLLRAMEIDEAAALKACSWGLGQVLGENHKMMGYATVQEMVVDCTLGEDKHLEMMVRFIKAKNLDVHLRAHDWARFAYGYNGSQYAKHNYHGRLASAYAKWRAIRDTPTTIPAPPKPQPPKPLTPKDAAKVGGVGVAIAAALAAIMAFAKDHPVETVIGVGVVAVIAWIAFRKRGG